MELTEDAIDRGELAARNIPKPGFARRTGPGSYTRLVSAMIDCWPGRWNFYLQQADHLHSYLAAGKIQLREQKVPL